MSRNPAVPESREKCPYRNATTVVSLSPDEHRGKLVAHEAFNGTFSERPTSAASGATRTLVRWFLVPVDGAARAEVTRDSSAERFLHTLVAFSGPLSRWLRALGFLSPSCSDQPASQGQVRTENVRHPFPSDSLYVWRVRACVLCLRIKGRSSLLHRTEIGDWNGILLTPPITTRNVPRRVRKANATGDDDEPVQ